MMTGLRRAITRAQDPEIAAGALFEALWQPDICLVLLFVSPNYNLDRLAPYLQDRFRGIALGGCTTSGEIGPGGYHDSSVCGFSLAAPDFAAAIGLIENLSRLDAGAMQAEVRRTRLAIYDSAPWARHENLFAITLIDGMCGCEELVASAACGALGGIPLRGGSAGDALDFEKTFVLHQGGFRTDCALIAVIATRRAFRAFKTEHFSASSEKCVVTGAFPRRRVVTEINAEPAAEEYARITGMRMSDLTPAAFATHPMMVRVGEQSFVRSIQRVNADRSLTFLCAIDEGVVLSVGACGDLEGGLARLFQDIESQIGPPELVIAFDCILRGLELDQRRIRGRAGALMDRANAVGFSTYGEQCEAMHMNQTFTGIAIGAADA
jgi:hypothetical protein